MRTLWRITLLALGVGLCSALILLLILSPFIVVIMMLLGY